jgi:hypothetical protein
MQTVWVEVVGIVVCLLSIVALLLVLLTLVVTLLVLRVCSELKTLLTSLLAPAN